MMSYCDPVWISDYNYAALHERVLDVARLSRGAEVEAFGIAVDADGWGTVGAALLTPARRSGQPVEVALHGAVPLLGRNRPHGRGLVAPSPGIAGSCTGQRRTTNHTSSP